ncbi:MAG TPA: hypothetical protein VKP30_32935, partial [Polyangiaceae bacterium]|nr:hypothetical protein [Polyangiaceae bacterium]
ANVAPPPVANAPRLDGTSASASVGQSSEHDVRSLSSAAPAQTTYGTVQGVPKAPSSSVKLAVPATVISDVDDPLAAARPPTHADANVLSNAVAPPEFRRNPSQPNFGPPPSERFLSTASAAKDQSPEPPPVQAADQPPMPPLGKTVAVQISPELRAQWEQRAVPAAAQRSAGGTVAVPTFPKSPDPSPAGLVPHPAAVAQVPQNNAGLPYPASTSSPPPAHLSPLPAHSHGPTPAIAANFPARQPMVPTPAGHASPAQAAASISSEDASRLAPPPVRFTNDHAVQPPVMQPPSMQPPSMQPPSMQPPVMQPPPLAQVPPHAQQPGTDPNRPSVPAYLELKPLNKLPWEK